MATIIHTDRVTEGYIRTSIYGFPKSLPTNSMNITQLEALQSSKYEITKNLGDLQLVQTYVSMVGNNENLYGIYRSARLFTVCPIYFTIKHSTMYNDGNAAHWTEPLSAMMPLFVDEGFYQVSTLDSYPDAWLDDDTSNSYIINYYQSNRNPKWLDTRDTSLAVHTSRMKTMLNDLMTFFVNYQNDFKGNMYREMPYLLVNYLLQELLPHTTKTYTNSTWSAKKTWYIKVTFTKKSTSNNHSNPSNVVNYVTMIQNILKL